MTTLQNKKRLIEVNQNKNPNIKLVRIYCTVNKFFLTYSFLLNFFLPFPLSSCLKVLIKDVRYFPKGLFPSGNFPRVFSQMATSQICNFQSGNFPNVHFPKLQFPKWQLPHEGKAATSQMYIFPSNNFSSGNFPMQEKRQIPKCTFSQVTISLNNLLYFL